jgi:chemotaxis protein histidine kinase CheA
LSPVVTSDNASLLPIPEDSNNSNLGSFTGSDGSGALTPTPISDKLQNLMREVQRLKQHAAAAIDRAEDAAAMAEATTAAAIEKADEAAQIAEALAQQQSEQLGKISNDLLPAFIEALAQIEGEVALVKHLANSVAREATETKTTRAALEVSYANTESKATDAAGAAATHLASMEKIKKEFEELKVAHQAQVEEVKRQVANIQQAIAEAQTLVSKTIETAREARQHADEEARCAATTKATKELIKQAQDKLDETKAVQEEALQKIQTLIQDFARQYRSATQQLQTAERTLDANQIDSALTNLYIKESVLRRRQIRDAVKSVIQDFALALLFGAGLALIVFFPPASSILAILLLAITGVGAVVEIGFTLSAARRWWQLAHDQPLPPFSSISSSSKPWASTMGSLFSSLGMELDSADQPSLESELVQAAPPANTTASHSEDHTSPAVAMPPASTNSSAARKTT